MSHSAEDSIFNRLNNLGNNEYDELKSAHRQQIQYIYW